MRYFKKIQSPRMYVCSHSCLQSKTDHWAIELKPTKKCSECLHVCNTKNAVSTRRWTQKFFTFSNHNLAPRNLAIGLKHGHLCCHRRQLVRLGSEPNCQDGWGQNLFGQLRPVLHLGRVRCYDFNNIFA
jgi:hypothetical protein